MTRQILMQLLKDYRRPNDKISELVKKGELTILKKGFYIPGDTINVRKPEPFLIANHLWGPSYVSLESALSHWEMIPERVFEISSITSKRSKHYSTPMGRFSYFHADLPYYSFGIRSVTLTARQVVLMASPEKALCDKIVMTSGIFLRSTKQTRAFLVDDLRIDDEFLRKLDLRVIVSWIPDAPKKSSLDMLVKTLRYL